MSNYKATDARLDTENYASPPHSEETERAVLGAVLLDNSLAAIIMAELTADDFYSATRRHAFAAMRALYERDVAAEINHVALIEEIRRKGFAHEVLFADISNFTYGLPLTTPKTLKGYIATLRRKTALRQALQLVARTDERLRRDNEPPEEILAEVSAQIESVRQRAKFGATALRLACMADIEAAAVSWLWPPYIPIGKLTFLEGEEGLGKSWLTCILASAVSTGNGLPPNFEPLEAENVLMLSAEDGLADTIKPRLVACGADTKRIFAVNEPLTFDEKGLIRLEGYIAEISPVLVTIDPLFAYTPARIDINSANQSRALSSRLADIAAKFRCAILPVRHIGKAKGNGDPRNAGLGSIDWRAAVRSVLLVGKNPDNERERALVQTKNNLAPFGDAIGFTIEGTADGAKFRWSDKCDLTASRILGNALDDNNRVEQSDAVNFLSEVLRDGEQRAKDVTKQAEELGITEKQLRTARLKLGITTQRHGGAGTGEDKFWSWQLPSHPEDARSQETAINTNGHFHAEPEDKTPLLSCLTKDAQHSAGNDT
ncbi:MAG: hypothetical protein QOE33_3524 [Acidobacteriota bacterium]|nr:hypothetical protein [Acidobacteriota bacterium]